MWVSHMIVVIDSGKHRCINQLHKLQLDGKIVNTSTIASKNVSNFQSQLNNCMNTQMDTEAGICCLEAKEIPHARQFNQPCSLHGKWLCQ